MTCLFVVIFFDAYQADQNEKVGDQSPNCHRHTKQYGKRTLGNRVTVETVTQGTETLVGEDIVNRVMGVGKVPRADKACTCKYQDE